MYVLFKSDQSIYRLHYANIEDMCNVYDWWNLHKNDYSKKKVTITMLFATRFSSKCDDPSVNFVLLFKLIGNFIYCYHLPEPDCIKIMILNECKK